VSFLRISFRNSVGGNSSYALDTRLREFFFRAALLLPPAPLFPLIFSKCILDSPRDGGQGTCTASPPQCFRSVQGLLISYQSCVFPFKLPHRWVFNETFLRLPPLTLSPRLPPPILLSSSQSDDPSCDFTISNPMKDVYDGIFQGSQGFCYRTPLRLGASPFFHTMLFLNHITQLELTEP